MGAESMGTQVIPCNLTHGDGHSSFYEGNHGDYDLSYFSVKFLPLCGAVSYQDLQGNVVLRLTLDDLPGNSSSKDKLQMYREGIRTQKYLGKKLPPPH